jgi:hypothetical protein
MVAASARIKDAVCFHLLRERGEVLESTEATFPSTLSLHIRARVSCTHPTCSWWPRDGIASARTHPNFIHTHQGLEY